MEVPPWAGAGGPGMRGSTFSVWPPSVCKGTAARRSHSRNDASWDAVTKWYSDVGCHATAAIQSLCEASAFTPWDPRCVARSPQ